jgi:hypothetical protein
MGVIVGSDGAVQLDLGAGNKYVANTFSWTVKTKREMLNRTNLSDDAKRRTAGIADWTGNFSFRLQLSDDTAQALSAYQILEHLYTKTGDELKAQLHLVLQRGKLPPDYDIFNSTIGGVVKLVGTVVIETIGLDCATPENPVIARADWEGDGALALVRT